MSIFRRNLVASYASQIYVSVIGIAMVPLYIRHMGTEAYGLVGFFAVLQGWFSLLDMGLTPTMARESARYSSGATSPLDYRRLVRALEGLFAVIALLGGALLFALAEPVASQWLKASQLPQGDITQALKLMALVIALRWISGLYRGVIAGAERLVWLSGYNSLAATGRFVLVLPVLMFIDASPQMFFGFQLIVAFLESAGLAGMAYRLLPTLLPGTRIRWQWTPLRPVLKFSLSIALTSSLWVLVTQSDKLLLSRILSLTDFGYFSVAVLAASGIMIVTGPVSSTLMPRMARLEAEGRHDALIDVYRQATQIVSVTALPAALLLIFFAPQVLRAWTGDAALVERTTPALRLYAAGYAFLAVGAFPYYLQYAKGDLRLHVIGSALFVLTLIPSVLWATNHYGIEGAGWAWLISNFTYFLLWTPLVHQKFAQGVHASWLSADIAKPVLLPLIFAGLAARYLEWPDGRVALALQLTAMGGVFLLLAYALKNRAPFMHT